MATISELETAGHKLIRLPWWKARAWLDISGVGPWARVYDPFNIDSGGSPILLGDAARYVEWEPYEGPTGC
jgi:hypothetical protein